MVTPMPSTVAFLGTRLPFLLIDFRTRQIIIIRKNYKRDGPPSAMNTSVESQLDQLALRTTIADFGGFMYLKALFP